MRILQEGAATGGELNDSNDLQEGDERREQITGGTGGKNFHPPEGEPRWIREALLPDRQRGTARRKVTLRAADYGGVGGECLPVMPGAKHKGGRPPKYGPDAVEIAKEMRANGETIRGIAAEMKASTATIQKLLRM